MQRDGEALARRQGDPDASPRPHAAARPAAARPRCAASSSSRIRRVPSAIRRGCAAAARGSQASTSTPRRLVSPRMSSDTDPRATTIRPGADWRSGGEYEDIRYELSGDGHREDHDRPPGGPQRVPAADDHRDLPRARGRARGHVGRRDHPHRRGRPGVLLRRRPARARRHRLPDDPRAARASAASTSPTCTSRSGACRSRSSRWSPATRSAAATCCTSCCDLTIAADNARFGQTGPKVGSFDGGFGASLLADLVGPKKAKEIWFLCRQYDAAAGAARWGSSTPSCRSTTSRSRRWRGAARCSPSPRSRCAC